MPVSFVSTPPTVETASGVISIEFESGGVTVSVALSRKAAYGLNHSLGRLIADMEAPGNVTPFTRNPTSTSGETNHD